VGTDEIVYGSRSGDLQIAQLFDGASQPSTLAASLAGAMLYAPSNDNGYLQSTSNILNTGDLNWSADQTPGVVASSANGVINGATNSTTGAISGGAGVATDPTGSGQLYQYIFPSTISSPLAPTDFFQVTPAGQSAATRVSGLVQNGDSPGTNTGEWPEFEGSDFAVNSFDKTAIVISSQAGGVWLTAGAHTGGTGVTWKEIGAPNDLDGSIAEALAFGAPATTTGQLDNFIYAGTADGNIFVTFTGGGYNGGAAWLDLSQGLDGSAIQQIVTDPKPGSTDAYAVTLNGVFYMPNAVPSASNPNPTWIQINDQTGQSTFLNQAAGLTANATSMIVKSSAGFPPTPFVVQLNNEQILVTNVNAATNTWTIVRGYNGTVAAAAADFNNVTLLTDQLFGTARPMFNPGSTTTTAAVTAAATTITVASDASFPTVTPFIVDIGNEQVDVTNVSVTGGTVTWTVIRGYNGTTAAAYVPGTVVTTTTDDVQTL
jgi:hypothetical protein